MAKKQTLIIIDGNAIVHRAFHAIPPLTTKKGQIVNAVYGFTTTLLKVIKELSPTHMVVTFDLPEPTFRHEAYAAYKAQRQKQPDELYEQIPLVKEVVRAFCIPIYEKKGFEADDIIGTVAAMVPSSVRTVIVTGDLDILQLVDDHTFVYTFKRSMNDTVTYDADAVRERFGLLPKQMIDYKTLRGDPSDNIPGVPGIGEKTASALLQAYGTVEKVVEAAKEKAKRKETRRKTESPLSTRFAALITEHAKDVPLAKKLVTIVRDVKIDFSLDDALLKTADTDVIVDLFQKLEFKNLLARMMKEGRVRKKVVAQGKQGELFGGGGEDAKSAASGLAQMQHSEKGTQNKKLSDVSRQQSDARYSLITSAKELKEFLRSLQKQKFFALDTETTGVDAMACDLLGVSFSWKKGEAWYVPVRVQGAGFRVQEKSKEWKTLADILADADVKKTGHNIKYDLKVLARHRLPIRGVRFDSMVASYLIYPGTRAHSLDSVAFSEFGYRMQPLEDLIGSKGKDQKSVADVPLNDLAWYAAEDADYSMRLVAPLQKELREKMARALMDRVETPLIPVLADMEMEGIKIDEKFLSVLQKRLAKRIVELDALIQKEAGVNFNVNSPSQLKEVLFTKLKIDSGLVLRTKTGFSTAASELEKLKSEHPIIPRISEYRELAKLQSTYVEALPRMVNKQTRRIHTTFHQALTTTGRISSSDPNLQNIPIRTELGREMRKAFVAERGYTLLSIDYSQIELRIVASLANDKTMIEAFTRGEDIHARTAADINGIALKDVSAKQRRAAKEVNFGVLYGMGAWGLSSRTGISRSAAHEFIKRYFAARPRVKEYLDETVQLARKMGYVETLFSRRRYLPDIQSGVGPVRAAAERMAVNMPIQGTAADLMKLAIIAVADHVRKKYHWREHADAPVRMLLSVHDELVFEVKTGMEQDLASEVKEIMEGVEKLRVPIVADAKYGKRWGEMR